MTKQLFWSESGRIECADHAPFPGSDSWRYDHWQRITDADAAAFARDVGRPVACETCAAIERRGGAQ